MTPLMHDVTKQELEKLRSGGTFIVYGPKGSGKTSLVREFLSANRPLILSTTEKTIAVAQVRELSQQLYLTNWSDKGQVIIIEEAYKLTEAAQNSLLKTLEELPASVTMILITDELTQLLPTIISRCQSIYLHGLTASQLESTAARLAPNKEQAVEAVTLSGGSFERLQTILEDENEFKAAKERFLRIERLCGEDRYEALAAAASLQDDLPLVLDEIIAYVRSQLRQSADLFWTESLLSCRYAQELLASNVNKRYILDVIALKVKP